MATLLATPLRRRVSAEKAGDAPVLAVAAQKGGVGKTTTAVHLAWAFARTHHRRTLLVDLDPQGHVGAHLSAHCRVETTRRLGACLLDRRGDVASVAVPTSVDRLEVTNPDRSLHQVEVQLNARIGKELVLKRALSEARSRYDLIVLDCPPNLGNLTVGALVASTAVLVPTDTSRLALSGVDSLIETLHDLKEAFERAPRLAGVLLTRVDRRSRAYNEEVRSSLRELVGSALLKTEIPARTAVARAQAAGTSVFRQEPGGGAATAYEELAVTMLDTVTDRLSSRRIA
jgi:chromosome partitioning protein